MEPPAASVAATSDSGRIAPRVCSVSVAMATYNGEAHIDAQLASIAAQTRPPADLVVCDDGSSDATVEIVERFAREAPFEVRLIRNEQRLGYGENFMKAARISTGDVIAWSDQDDVWMPEKLARCAEQFERDPDVLLVVHSTEIVDGAADEKPRIAGPLSRYLSRPREVRALARRTVYTPAALPLEVNSWGHSCVVSRRVLELGDALEDVLPGVFDEFSGHDTWTLFLATAAGNAALLPDALTRYRQHVTQVAGAGARRALATRVAQSAARSDSSVVDGIEELATRAFFRASVLAQLAALLDGDAGLRRDATLFRTSLAAQIARRGEIGFGRGALERAAMWQRHGEVLDRRVELWRQQSFSKAAARLVRHTAGGDYFRPDRGGLGRMVLARDLWHLVHVAGGRSA